MKAQKKQRSVKGGAVIEPAPKAAVHHYYHRWQHSKITLSWLERQDNEIWHAINRELPWSVVRSWKDGLTLSEAVFKGIQRNGPNYIETYMRENHIIVQSMTSQLILNCLALYRGWITYDTLFQYLRDHNAGELTMDTDHKHIDKFPTYTAREERAERLAPIEAEEEKKRIVAHQDALKRRRLVKDLEIWIDTDKSQLEIAQAEKNTDDIVYYSNSIAEKTQRLEKAKKDLEVEFL